MQKVVLGIDPGLTGALAWVAVSDPASPPVLLDAVDMPTVQMKSGRSLKNFINLPALADAMRHPAIPFPVACYIEEVGASPGSGVTSMFRFGYAAGAAAATAATLGIPLYFVRPVGWQRQFTIKGKEKDKSRMVASQMFPARADLFKRKKDNGRSDAALIAVHGIRNFGAK